MSGGGTYIGLFHIQIVTRAGMHCNICNIHMDSLRNCPHISFYRPVVLRIKVSSFQGSGPIEVFVCIW